MRILNKILPESFLDALNQRRLRKKFSGLLIGKRCFVSDSSFGKTVNVSSDVTLLSTEVGDYTYIGPGCVMSNVKIGRYCSIAPQVYIGLGTHPSRKFVSTHPIFYLNRLSLGWSIADRDYLSEFSPTDVGNDVWIGLRAAIRDGVTIGDGAIIGAGAVIVKDVPPYTIWGGVPARQIRERFSRVEIDFLLTFRWWEKDENWIRRNFRRLHDISELMKDEEVTCLEGEN